MSNVSVYQGLLLFFFFFWGGDPLREQHLHGCKVVEADVEGTWRGSIARKLLFNHHLFLSMCFLVLRVLHL